MISLTSTDFERHCRELATAILATMDGAGEGCSIGSDRQGRELCHADIEYHLGCLLPSVVTGNSVLFCDYVAWVKVLFHRIGIPEADFRACLKAIRAVVGQRPDLVDTMILHQTMDRAEAHLAMVEAEPPSFLTNEKPHGALASDYLSALLASDRRRANSLILDVAAGGMKIKELYTDVFQPVMYEIGRLWQTGAITVAQEHYCTAMTQFTMSQLYPYIFSDGPKGNRCLVATCASGEQHELGMRMVADIFQLEGWNTHFLGANVPKAGVIRMLVDVRADVLALSTTLTSNLPRVADLIAAVRSQPELAAIKVIVGGLAFRAAPELWRTVNADGYAADTMSALSLAETLKPAAPN